jgi:hypothetical protein
VPGKPGRVPRENEHCIMKSYALPDWKLFQHGMSGSISRSGEKLSLLICRLGCPSWFNGCAQRFFTGEPARMLHTFLKHFFRIYGKGIILFLGHCKRACAKWFKFKNKYSTNKWGVSALRTTVFTELRFNLLFRSQAGIQRFERIAFSFKNVFDRHGFFCKANSHDYGVDVGRFGNIKKLRIRISNNFFKPENRPYPRFVEVSDVQMAVLKVKMQLHGLMSQKTSRGLPAVESIIGATKFFNYAKKQILTLCYIGVILSLLTIY